MSEIDYEALAKATWDRDYQGEVLWDTAIKSGFATQRLQNVVAVVAALRDQGMVVVRREDIDTMLGIAGRLPGALLPSEVDSCERLAALAAPEHAGEEEA